MAKRNSGAPQVLNEKLHRAKFLLIDITLFILLIAVLLRILLHEAVPVLVEVSQKLLHTVHLLFTLSVR